MTLREAIDARHSVRAYKNQPLTEDIVKTLEEQITICNKKGKLHIQLILNEPKAFQGTLAKYGKFRNVSNYIVMAGQTSNDLDERIDKLNQADSMIFSTENFLNENGDKLPADQRPAIDSALQQLKDAHKNGDIAAIDTAMNNLNQVMQTASQQMYQQAGAAQQGPDMNAGTGFNGTAGSGFNGQQSNGQQTNQTNGDNIQDADFEEVK